MSNLKISQLQQATSTTASDSFMIVQGNSNKRLTLASLLGHLDSPVTVNSGLLNLNFTVNGVSPNLLCTDAQTNTVGVRTNKAENAALQVVGDVRVGGTKVTNTTISTAPTLGAADSGGPGKKLVTVTTSTNHGFVAGDNINITGITTVTALNGLKKVSVIALNQFTFTVTNDVTGTPTLGVSPTATRTTYYPGVYKGSYESYLVPPDEVTSTHALDASYSVTALLVSGACTFQLSAGSQGQEKYMYLKSIVNTGDKATITVGSGLGFNRIQFQKVGDGVQLIFDGDVWIVTGVNGAIISTV